MYSKIARVIEKYTTNVAPKLLRNFYKVAIQQFLCMDKLRQVKPTLCWEMKIHKV
jgi:hypothetical protein